MKLKNAPWKVIESEDQIVVTDSEDWDVFSALIDEEEAHHLPGSVDDERAKAAAIARLPDILEELGTIAKLDAEAQAGEFFKEDIFNLCVNRLVEIHNEIEKAGV